MKNIFKKLLLLLVGFIFLWNNSAHAQELKPQLVINKNHQSLFIKTPPSNEIFVIDCLQDEPAAKLSAMALQGLINSKKAEVYLLLAPHHLDQLKLSNKSYQKLSVTGTKNSGLMSLFKKYASSIKHLYVWDPDKDWTFNIALMLSSQNQGVLVTEDIKTELLKVVNWKGSISDISNRWADRTEAYNWAISNLLPNCNHKISFSAGLRSDWTHNPWTIFDYAVATKGFTYWLNDSSKIQNLLLNNIYARDHYKSGSIVMGYAQSGDDLLDVVNPHGIGYIVSDYYANGSYWSSFPEKKFDEKEGKAIKAQVGKVYVCLIWSDGDNLQFDQNALYQIWQKDSLRGKIPTGTTLAAGLTEINPALINWYYRHKTDNDELMAGPSGYQFIYGDQYQNSTFESWCNENKLWMRTAGFKTACLWHTTFGTKKFDTYLKVSGLEGVFDGNDKVGVQVKYGTAVLNQGDHCFKEGDVYYNLSRINADSDKPIFHSVYLISAAYGFTHGKIDAYTKLKREIDKLNKEFPGKYVFLLPKDLAATILKTY